MKKTITVTRKRTRKLGTLLAMKKTAEPETPGHEVRVVEIIVHPDGTEVVSQCCDHRRMPTMINDLHRLGDKTWKAEVAKIIAGHHESLRREHEAHSRGMELKQRHADGESIT